MRFFSAMQTSSSNSFSFRLASATPSSVTLLGKIQSGGPSLRKTNAPIPLSNTQTPSLKLSSSSKTFRAPKQLSRRVNEHFVARNSSVHSPGAINRFQSLWPRSLPTLKLLVQGIQLRHYPSPLQSTRFGTRRHRLQKHEARCAQVVITGLYVAFGDDNAAFHSSSSASRIDIGVEELRTFEGRDFTHIIEIYHPSQQELKDGVPSTQLSMDKQGRIRYLRLSLPPIPPYGSHKFEKYLISKNLSMNHRHDFLSLERTYILDIDTAEENGTPQLTATQILAARDFLHSSGLRLVSHAARSQAQVLVTTPRDARTDALCISAVFLAFLSGHKAAEVLNYMDQKPDCLSIWKGVVSKESEEDLESLLWL